jgi:nitrate reductase NapAB chaperone NapD
MVLDRRRFLSGGWPTGRPARELDHNATSCGVLVQARPGRLDEAVAAIMALGRIDLVARDARGRLTLAFPTADPAGVALTLNSISQLPGVLSATLTGVAPSRTGVSP